MNITDINMINAAVLAYLGDAVYEIHVRNYLISKKISKVNDLQRKSVDFVSANAQCEILDKLLLENIFDEDELYTIGRAKNYKPNTKAKHADIKTYKKATALEALFGMLYLQENDERINQIMNKIFEESGY